MKFIPIPLALLDSTEYRDLARADRLTLLDLYFLHADCYSFTLSFRDHNQLGYADHSGLYLRLRRLIASGLLICDVDSANTRKKTYRFKHSAVDFYK